jgi:acyl-CoA synthetase (AMP-forming)/AMP-acid ligase II
MVSHGNLFSNIGFMIERYGSVAERKTMVIWLPAFHDMGLIGGLLQAIRSRIRCILISPLAFVTDPMIWLRSIHKFRGTFGGAPNFAFELCVKRSTAAERRELDLSSWRICWTGAEPVRSSVSDSDCCLSFTWF